MGKEFSYFHRTDNFRLFVYEIVYSNLKFALCSERLKEKKRYTTFSSALEMLNIYHSFNRRLSFQNVLIIHIYFPRLNDIYVIMQLQKQFR